MFRKKPEVSKPTAKAAPVIVRPKVAPREAPKVSSRAQSFDVEKPVHNDLEALGLLTDPSEIEKESKRLSSRKGNKLWMVSFSPGQDSSLIWVRRYLGVIFLHNIPSKSPSGKMMSEKNICSGPETVRGDCGFCDAGYRASKYFVYEVVNITGRKNKDGETLRNLPSLYIMNETRHDIFLKTAKKQLKGGLSSKMIEVETVGSGTQSTHLYTIVDKAIPDSVKSVEGLNIQDYLVAQDRETQELIAKEAEPYKAATAKKGKTSGAKKDYSDLEDLFD